MPWWLALLFIAGVALPVWAASPADFVGMTEQQLIQRLGFPDRQSGSADQTFMTYDNRDWSYVRGSTGIPGRRAVFDCRTVFVLRADRVVAFHRSGNYCR